MKTQEVEKVLRVEQCFDMTLVVWVGYEHDSHKKMTKT